MGRWPLGVVAVAAVLATACSSTPAEAPAPPTAVSPAELAGAGPPQLVHGPDAIPEPLRRPAWLGTRVLPEAPHGFGVAVPTPIVLRDRRLPPPADRLPDPTDASFVATVGPVPDVVAARSTWQPACPVALEDLRYVTLTFWGFDERAHTGELLVHRDAAEVVVAAFEAAYAERFPIEEVRVVSPADLDAPMTGDGNTTTAFVCRPVRGSSAWSQHAYGLALDVNPFHNPYRKGEVVLPELASAYLDRSDQRPGMLTADSALVRVLEAAGWGWGGRWESLDDWMHLSASGR